MDIRHVNDTPAPRYGVVLAHDNLQPVAIDANDRRMPLRPRVGTATNAAAAVGYLSTSANPLADQTVTIGAVTYTFKAAVSTTANQVKIGATQADSVANLVAAINAGAGSGTLYGSLTVAHPIVDAVVTGSTNATIMAKSLGPAGNIPTAETLTAGSFNSATMTGGKYATVGLVGDMVISGGSLMVCMADVGPDSVSEDSWKTL